jgi:hypothetical protein
VDSKGSVAEPENLSGAIESAQLDEAGARGVPAENEGATARLAAHERESAAIDGPRK